MVEAWLPSLILVLGMAAGQALAAYAGWMIRCRRGEAEGGMSWKAAMAASLANGLGWLAAWIVFPGAVKAADFALMVSSAIVLTLIDVRIRVIPNELVAALLCLSAALALMGGGIAALPERCVGFLVALTLFLVAMWIAGQGKVGGGDVKLAAVVGFAAGFPGVLAAVLVMALAAVAAGAAGMTLGRMGRRTKLPFAGFLMAGLVVAKVLDATGALGFLQ